MRKYPDLNDEYDVKEVGNLKADDWQLNLLKLNPEYTSWGPHEDYMYNENGEKGWNCSQFYNSWSDFGPWHLDELNEIVNFYFELERTSHECPDCEGTAYNKATKKLSDDWYGVNYQNGWNTKLEKEEVAALFAQRRLFDFKTLPTPEEVNKAYSTGLGHDAINRWICVETRAKKLGVWGKCPTCSGIGKIYDEPNSHVNLVLWVLHPRKGCSRGVEIKNIQESEIPTILDYLQEAANRNYRRFDKILLTGY